MRRFKIGFDMDGMTVELYQYWLDVIAQRYGVLVTPEEITRWEMHKCGALTTLLPAQVYGLLDEEEFWANAPPIPGGLEALKILSDAHDVVIISTATATISPSEKYKWLTKHAPWFNRQNVFFCARKDMVKLDFLLDDKADTLIAYEKAWPGAEAIGIAYPYNRNIEGIHLIGDYRQPKEAWEQIVRYIDECATAPIGREVFA